MTFETFDRSAEERGPDQKNTNKDKYKDTYIEKTPLEKRYYRLFTTETFNHLRLNLIKDKRQKQRQMQRHDSVCELTIIVA